MIVELVHQGFSEGFVLDLPMPEFHTLYDISMRVKYRNLRNEAYVAHVAAQGSTKSFQKATESWKKIGNAKIDNTQTDIEKIFKGRTKVAF